MMYNYEVRWSHGFGGSEIVAKYRTMTAALRCARRAKKDIAGCMVASVRAYPIRANGLQDGPEIYYWTASEGYCKPKWTGR